MCEQILSMSAELSTVFFLPSVVDQNNKDIMNLRKHTPSLKVSFPWHSHWYPSEVVLLAVHVLLPHGSALQGSTTWSHTSPEEKECIVLCTFYVEEKYLG